LGDDVAGAVDPRRLPLAVAALLPLLFGADGDRYGRRAAFTIGLFGFAAASVVGALASTPEQLIGARAARGVAGALIMPATLAYVRVLFTDPQAFRVSSPYRVIDVHC
jgi:DHA2 family multidrug resistance protein-like MFS transporter